MSAQPKTLPKTARQRRKRKASDARIAAALIANAGNCSEVGRVLRMARQSIEDRVKRTPMLQAAMAQGEATFGEVAEGQLVRAIKKGDGASVRYFLDRKVPGYRPKWVEGDAQAAAAALNPQDEALRAIAMKALLALVEERAARGERPIFNQPSPAIAGPLNSPDGGGN